MTDEIIAKILGMKMCHWSKKKNVTEYNREIGHKIVGKCDNIATWHNTYCDFHHKEGWGSCTCHPIQNPQKPK